MNNIMEHLTDDDILDHDNATTYLTAIAIDLTDNWMTDTAATPAGSRSSP